MLDWGIIVGGLGLKHKLRVAGPSLTLAEIAQFVPTTAGTLEVWRSQVTFRVATHFDAVRFADWLTYGIKFDQVHPSRAAMARTIPRLTPEAANTLQEAAHKRIADGGRFRSFERIQTLREVGIRAGLHALGDRAVPLIVDLMLRTAYASPREVRLAREVERLQTAVGQLQARLEARETRA